MCSSVIINGQEFEEIDGTCTCPASWERIMQFIGANTKMPAIGEELVIRRDAFDYVVQTRTFEGDTQ
jgi:hypothetical protein